MSWMKKDEIEIDVDNHIPKKTGKVRLPSLNS